jgi:hypothetical protein
MSEFISGRDAQDAMRKLRTGMALPNNPRRAIEKIQSVERSMRDGSAVRTAMSAASSGERRGPRIQRASSMQIALEKPRGPLDRFTQSSIPHEINDQEERMKIRDLCRTYYKIHNLVPLLIDIYCRFPIQGMTIEHDDPDLKQFYEQLFFDDLEYESFLIDFGREFFTIGEVNSLASFSELLGIWEGEQIINPDDLTVSQSPFSKEQRYHLRVPEDIKQIIERRQPRADYEMLKREYPEIIDAAKNEDRGLLDDSWTGPGLEISNVLLSRLVNKTAAWDLYGTPHMLRVFQNLNLEEGLLAAQKAIADRLYSPLILAKLGSPDLGDGGAWIPSIEELDTFSDLMNQAMSADFRFLTYHYGIEIESVFGRENVPNLDNDFDRIERKILQAWGIGESLISGSSNGSYASSALNSELVNQLMSSYQKFVQKHFKKRCEVVAEAQGHFAYDVRGGTRYPIIEEYIEVDPETGEETVQKRPQLAIPELKFKSITLRDEETERQFLLTLKQSGVPVSDQILMESVDLEFEKEIDKIVEEKADKVIAQQELQQKLIKVLQERGLPLPPELLLTVNQQTTPAPPQVPGMPSPGVGQDITTPVNTPDVAPDPMGAQAAQMNGMTLPVMDPSMQGMPAPGGPGGAPMAPTAGVVPQAPQSPGTPGALPQNQIAQRPEISNNQFQGMPRRSHSSMRHDPSIIGLRSKLTEESVNELVKNRPWVRSLKPKK